MNCDENNYPFVSSTFNVEPPRIIKKKTSSVPGTKFSAELKIDINAPVQNVQVQVFCLSFPQPLNIEPYSCGQQKLAKQKENYWICELKDLLFTKVLDSDGSHAKPNNRVTDIRSWLLFQVKFIYNEHEVVKEFIHGPVITVVHSNQEPAAHGTLWWYENFPLSQYPKYDMSLSVKTTQLIDAIKKYFSDFLNPSHVNFILERILRPIERDDEISFKDFVHTPYRSHTGNSGSLKSWKWLHYTRQLFDSICTQSMWRLGLIVGFITKQRSEEWLKDQPQGTFLLRFSESQPGTILVVVVHRPGDIKHWEPFTKQELETEDLKSRLIKYVPQILRKFYNKHEDALASLLQVNIGCSELSQSNAMPSGYTKRPDAGSIDATSFYTSIPDFNDDLNVAQHMDVDDK